jgi:hypothetical protein
MLGVKTIGNATLVAYEDKPVLTTDPWLGDIDEAYFGSWKLSHVIPEDIRADILASKFVWFSHGHPDHLNPGSAERFHNATILLPDHVGGRIRRDLEERGYRVQVLPDKTWIELSPRIKVFCMSDYIQDAVLLVDVGGRLFINMNDCGARAGMRLIPKITKEYKDSYLLTLSGYGDADMINLFDASGKRIESTYRPQVGRFLSRFAARVGARNVIPFSSFHRYNRTDSVWADDRTTPVSAYRVGFDEQSARYIDPFAWVDCDTGAVEGLWPAETTGEAQPPEAFGDNWSDPLEAEDRTLIDDYFLRLEALRRMIGFIEFKVGGSRHVVRLEGPKDRGITFETPRASLVTAVSYKVFDDLLIGNFTKTTLHNIDSLYDPNFNFVVTKYGDNGGAETQQDIDSYLRVYRERAGITNWMLHHMAREGHTLFRRYVRRDSKIYSVARDIYQRALTS